MTCSLRTCSRLEVVPQFDGGVEDRSRCDCDCVRLPHPYPHPQSRARDQTAFAAHLPLIIPPPRPGIPAAAKSPPARSREPAAPLSAGFLSRTAPSPSSSPPPLSLPFIFPKASVSPSRQSEGWCGWWRRWWCRHGYAVC